MVPSEKCLFIRRQYREKAGYIETYCSISNQNKNFLTDESIKTTKYIEVFVESNKIIWL